MLIESLQANQLTQLGVVWNGRMFWKRLSHAERNNVTGICTSSTMSDHLLTPELAAALRETTVEYIINNRRCDVAAKELAYSISYLLCMLMSRSLSTMERFLLWRPKIPKNLAQPPKRKGNVGDWNSIYNFLAGLKSTTELQFCEMAVLFHASRFRIVGDPELVTFYDIYKLSRETMLLLSKLECADAFAVRSTLPSLDPVDGSYPPRLCPCRNSLPQRCCSGTEAVRTFRPKAQDVRR